MEDICSRVCTSVSNNHHFTWIVAIPATRTLSFIMEDALRPTKATVERLLVAQSSDALSSAQFMLEKEAAQLENSHREIE